VVPRTGVQHIQVGRVNEVKQVMLDIDRIADQGSAVRFFIGDYGSGKTFFLNMARSMAVQRRLVVVHADLSADRRIHASGGHVRSFYAELMRNMATRTKPEGGALASVVESFVGEGQNTKLKLVKRQMYGRTNLDLLRARLLGAA
jgi:type II secretory pathway predicted ATPase ExeA